MKDAPQYGQIKDELSNMGDALDIKRGIGSSESTSLSEIVSMEWGDRAKQEWKKARKDLVKLIEMVDKKIVKAKKLRDKAEKAKSKCKQS